MATIWGWVSRAAALASRLKRATKASSSDRCSCRILMATGRASTSSRAFQTRPIPPVAMGDSSTYRPARVVLASDDMEGMLRGGGLSVRGRFGPVLDGADSSDHHGRGGAAELDMQD